MILLRTLSRAMLLAGVTAALVAAPARSQTPPDYPSQAYPQQAYPQQAYPQPYPGGQSAEPRPSIRELFANTLAAVLRGTASAATFGLASVITGRIDDWFSRRQRGSTPPQPSPDHGYPQPGYPQDPSQSQAQYGAGVQYYDPYTGQATSDYNYEVDSAVYAGLAYELHALTPEGYGVPVNPATHTFRTGERFTVHFRPSLPGRMDVYNINPAGREVQIDSTTMPAGQLTTLGPYQFTDMKGDEWLRLVLWPCSSPQLLDDTRDIINVSAESMLLRDVETDAAALDLTACDAMRTRSMNDVTTRDIRNVAHEGTTSFALDAVSQHELTSGQLQPREVRILFRHH